LQRSKYFRKSMFLIAAVVLFIAVSPITSVAYTWKILPIGNSITDGKEGVPGGITNQPDPTDPGFRKRLYDQLSSWGLDFEFVGSSGSAPYLGHFQSGRKIEDFFSGSILDVDPVLQSYQPEIVLLHLGTNNLSDDAGPYTNSWTMGGKLRQLIKQIEREASVQYILVSKIIPRLDVNYIEMVKVRDFNAEIEKMFFSGDASAKMVVVDMYSQVSANGSALPDGIHPQKDGYQNIAEEYADLTRLVMNGDSNSPNAVDVRNDGSYAVDDNTIRLEWFTPADDNFTGRPNLYELRYMVDVPINSSNFRQGTVVSIRRPGRNSSGSVGGTEAVTISSGLQGGRTYNFAIRSWDAGNNSSSIRNFNQLTTPLDIEADVALTFVDEFDDPALPAWNAHPDYETTNGAFKNANISSGWASLAVLDSVVYSNTVEQVEASTRWMSGGGIDGIGIAMLLDNSNYDQANGYMVRIREGKVELWGIEGGELKDDISQTPFRDSSVIPAPGDTVKVKFRNNPSSYSFELSVNDKAMGSVNDYNRSYGHATNLYSGLLLYGGYGSEVDAFTLKIPHLQADRMFVYGGDGQSGYVDSKLGSPLSVQIVDINGAGVPNVPVEFDVWSGSAFLSTDPDSICENFQGNIWIEGEDGIIEYPMTIGKDTEASNNRYAYTLDAYEGKARYSFWVPCTGDYELWMRVNATDGNSNSVRYAMDDTTAWTSSSSFNDGIGWYWEKLSDSYSLDNDFHTFYLKGRDANTKIDRILLTSNYSYSPTGTGGTPERLPNITDSKGIASTEVTFDWQAGAVQIRAYAETVPHSNDTTFSINANAGSPTLFEYAMDSSIVRGQAGQWLSDTFKVYLEDQYGNPRTGELVLFEITSGDGQLSGGDPMKAFTDDLGIARALLKLGWDTETRVKAYANDFPELGELYFSGVADEGSLAKSVTFIDGNEQEALVTQTLPTPLKVQVLNDEQEPVERYAVQFDVIQGNGKLNGQFTSVIDSTDADGYASVNWTLGQSAGIHKVKLVNIPLTPINNDSLIFVASARPDAPNEMENISGDQQSQGAGKMFTEPLRIRIVDQYNNGIANYGVEFTVVAGNGDGYFEDVPGQMALTVITDAQGYAQVRYSAGRQTGQNQVKAEGIESPELPVKNYRIFYLTVDAAKPQTLIKQSEDVQHLQVTKTLAPFSVKVLDPFGDSAPAGVRVRFQVIKGTSTFGTSSFVEPETNDSGIASAAMSLGFRTGEQEAQVTLPDYPDVEPVVFTAIAEPGAAEKIEPEPLSATTFSKEAASTQQLSVLVMDRYDNATPGHDVYFSVEQGNGTLIEQNNNYQIKSIAADDSGRALILYKLGTNSSVLNRIKCWAKTPDGATELGGSPFWYEATVLADEPAAIVKVSGANQSGRVMHALADSFLVQIRDKFQNPIAQKSVRFGAKSHGSSINGQSMVSVQANYSGKAGVIFTLGDRAGQLSDTLVVTVPGFDTIQPLEFYASASADEANQMTIHEDSTWQRQLGISPSLLEPQILVADQFGNPIANHPVLFKVTQGAGTVSDKDSATASTDLNGIAKIVWKLGTTPGVYQLEASSENGGIALNNSPRMFSAVTTAGEPEEIILIQPDSIVVEATANHAILLKTQLVDHWKNSIANQTINFNVEQPASNKGVLIDDQNREFYEKQLQTDQDGYVEINFRPVQSTNIVKISCKKSDDAEIFKWLTIIGNAATAQRIEILSNHEVSVAANGDVSVQVAAFDDTEALVDGHTITFETEFGHLSSSGGYSTRQTQNGIAEEVWSVGTKTGRAVLYVDGNTPNGSPDSVIALIMPSAPFADSSRISLMSELNADPGSKAIVQIALSDSFNNPVNGYELLLTSEDVGVSFDQPTSPTDVSGVTYGSVSSSKAGVIHISAVLKSNPAFRLPPVPIFVSAGKPALLSLPEGETNQFVGNIGAFLKNPLTVIVTDANNNPVGLRQADVKFEIKNGGGYFDESGIRQASVETDSAGQAAVNLVLGTVANQTYMVQVDIVYPTGVGAQLVFTGQSREPETALPWSLTKISGDNIKAPVGQPMPEPFVVQVHDKDGVPVWSANSNIVQFAVRSGSGEFPDGNLKMTEKNGHASALYQMTGGGTHIVEAGIQGDHRVVLFTSFAQAGDAAKLAPVDSIELRGIVGREILDRINVMVMDEDNIPVDDVPVSFQVIEQPEQMQGAIIDQSPVISGASGQSGVATAQVRLGHKTGDYVIKASTNTLPESEFVLFRITALHDEAYYLAKSAGDLQHMTFNRELNEPIIVKVMDVYENPVPNENIFFFTEDAAAHGQPEYDHVLTDENGMAENRWTIGSNRTNELIAQKIGLRSWPNGSNNRFVAFGESNNFPEFSDMPTDTTVLHSDLFQLRLKAVDDDGDPLSYHITSTLPNGASFDAGTNTISWTPASGQKGGWTISYRVDDSRGGYDTGSTNVNIISQMRIYTFAPLEPFIKIPASGEQQFSIVVIDANGPVGYIWYVNDQLQEGGSASLLIKAEDYPLGFYSVKVYASDGLTQVVHSWSIKVKVELSSFSGESVPFTGVVLDWKTANEFDNIGFDVLRSSSKNGSFEKISGVLLTGSAGVYSFTDSTAAAGRTFFYKLEDVDRNGDRNQSDAILVTVNVPKDFMLLQNYPNPFNPTTTIRFQLPRNVDTKVSIFNIRGQHVHTLLDRSMEPGYHRLMWNGRNDAGLPVSSGVYYYRLQAGEFQSTVKMLLLK
jgi:hypothetical protein